MKDNAAGNPLITDTIVPRTMRRLVATGKPDDLKPCVAFIAELKDATVTTRAGRADPRAQGPAGRCAGQLEAVYAALLKDNDAEVKKLAQALAVNFRDLAAARAALAVAPRSRRRPVGRAHRGGPRPRHRPHRRGEAAAARDAAQAKTTSNCRRRSAHLGGYDGKDIPPAVLKGWKDYPPDVRTEAVNLLAGRKEWAGELLDRRRRQARAAHRPERQHDPAHAGLQGQDSTPRSRRLGQGPRHAGRAEQAHRHDARRLDKGPASFAAAARSFENQCAKCHKFEGRGHNVGPELDGAGRDIEYLLINVLDPNRVVGARISCASVTLKNGQVENGLLAAEDTQTITLKGENDALRVFARKDVERSRWSRSR